MKGGGSDRNNGNMCMVSYSLLLAGFPRNYDGQKPNARMMFLGESNLIMSRENNY